MPVPIVKVKLIVNDRYLISEYGIYKGVTMNVEKYISKSGDFVYYGMLIVRDDVKHNNAGKTQEVRFWKNEVKEIKPKKIKVMKREQGYYWVRMRGNWYIMLWDDVLESWFSCGTDIDYKDSNISEIDERRIERLI